jgi:hypothetical protein
MDRDADLKREIDPAKLLANGGKIGVVATSPTKGRWQGQTKEAGVCHRREGSGIRLASEKILLERIDERFPTYVVDERA